MSSGLHASLHSLMVLLLTPHVVNTTPAVMHKEIYKIAFDTALIRVVSAVSFDGSFPYIRHPY